jgi:signal peptidase complex subunit 2
MSDESAKSERKTAPKAEKSDGGKEGRKKDTKAMESKGNDDDSDDEEGEYEIEEEEEKVPEPRTIETGDSIKVKQVLDDATIEYMVSLCGYEGNFAAENVKLWIMFVSCLFPVIAQFYPATFPDNRLVLGLCCGSYFFLSTVLQCIISYIDVDLIMTTMDRKEYAASDDKDSKDSNNSSSSTEKVLFKTHPAIAIRTDFPKYQEWFTLKVHYASDKDDARTNTRIASARMYVGKYFTEEGEFMEDVYARDLATHVRRFEEGKNYGETKFDHKND